MLVIPQIYTDCFVNQPQLNAGCLDAVRVTSALRGGHTLEAHLERLSEVFHALLQILRVRLPCCGLCRGLGSRVELLAELLNAQMQLAALPLQVPARQRQCMRAASCSLLLRHWGLITLYHAALSRGRNHTGAVSAECRRSLCDALYAMRHATFLAIMLRDEAESFGFNP